MYYKSLLKKDMTFKVKVFINSAQFHLSYLVGILGYVVFVSVNDSSSIFFIINIVVIKNRHKLYKTSTIKAELESALLATSSSIFFHVCSPRPTSLAGPV